MLKSVGVVGGSYVLSIVLVLATDPLLSRVFPEAQPDRVYLPAYIASGGWVALRLDRDSIDWGEVKELLSSSYVLIAPTELAEAVQEEECDR